MPIKRNFVIDDWMNEYLEHVSKKHGVKSRSKILRTIISCFVICISEQYSEEHNPDYSCEDMIKDLKNAVNKIYKGGVYTTMSNFEFYGRISWEDIKKLSKKKRGNSKKKASP